uniref:ATP synthase complex subunit 8 n=1 Tax=Nothobranchius nubaensis TaxID=2607867 RepID=A0A518QNR2_9TELE|nr:ATP synthase F0 subunit 8 [Nothobranchius nubaensis]QDX07396.1 ATP synthase F0 subunit 8 [Nothobranchius nubaensis]
MPQLNPAPWLTIMLSAWLIFLTVIPPKVLAHTSPNNVLTQEVNYPKTDFWTWTWY